MRWQAVEQLLAHEVHKSTMHEDAGYLVNTVTLYNAAASLPKWPVGVLMGRQRSAGQLCADRDGIERCG